VLAGPTGVLLAVTTVLSCGVWLVQTAAIQFGDNDVDVQHFGFDRSDWAKRLFHSRLDDVSETL
jgi:hypothetical protein